jgi:predicted NBD/HSP70 family sugar kinase
MAGSRSDVLHLVRTGQAASRADIARLTGVSASTASARVDALVRRGLLHEEEASRTRAGRRPRRLSIAAGLGTIAAVDIGPSGATVGLADLGGADLGSAEVALDLADGPHEALAALAPVIGDLCRERPPLQAVCLGVPGPVGAGRDKLVSPARMPGWNGVDLRTLAEDLLGAPVVVENDANLIALGEQRRRAEPHGDLVVVKVDAGIGCGFIVAGQLYRGAGGLAGDVSHTVVPGAPAVPCSCGRAGCLDVVASGSAMLASLREAGVEAASTDDVLTLAHDGDPLATNLLREAGERVGAVLATVVSFLNPTDVVMAGSISAAPAFLSAVRSSIYGACLPATTADLSVSALPDTTLASMLGGYSLATAVAFERGPIAARL